MKDKYGETIYCTRCRHEIVDKKDLRVDKRGIVYCKVCYGYQEGDEYRKLDDVVLGHRTRCSVVGDDN